MTDIPEAAVEAAQRQLDWSGNMKDALEAAAPYIRKQEGARILDALKCPPDEDWLAIRDRYPLPYPEGVDYQTDTRWIDFGVECFELGFAAAKDHATQITEGTSND